MLGKESGHYYNRDGSPAYQVPNKSKGGMRPTRITDARKLDLVPSVTTIIRVMAAPGLENWKIDQGILAALTLPRNDGETDEQFVARVKQDSKEHAIKAAEFGTRIHGAIEQHYSGTPPAEDVWPFVQGVAKCLHENCPEQVWDTERTFANTEFGYGGCADLHSDEWLIDFKGKDGDLSDAKPYDEHAMQLAAYRAGLDILNARCAIVFFSRTIPGAVKFCEVEEKDLQRAGRCLPTRLHSGRSRNDFESPTPQE